MEPINHSEHKPSLGDNSNYINSIKAGTITRANMVKAEEIFKELTEFDPQTLVDNPGCVVFVGATACGKTFTMTRFLYEIHKNYDKIYMISTTATLQRCYDYIPRENIMEYNDNTEPFLINLFETQKVAIEAKLDYDRWKESKKSNKDSDTTISSEEHVRTTKTTKHDPVKPKKVDKILLILDDVIHLKAFRNSQLLRAIFQGGRHRDIKVIILSQRFTAIPPDMRTNIRWAISFDLDSAHERETFARNFISDINHKVGDLVFQKVVKEKKYQCIVVEAYKGGVGTVERTKKYIAPAEAKKFKIKSVSAEPEYTKLKSIQTVTPSTNIPTMRTRESRKPRNSLEELIIE